LSKTEGKGTVNITTADQLENYSKGEEQEMETLIKGIAEAGANVVVSSQTLSDITLHYVEKYKVTSPSNSIPLFFACVFLFARFSGGILFSRNFFFQLMALVVQSKFNLRRICVATKATPLVRIGKPLPEVFKEYSIFIFSNSSTYLSYSYFSLYRNSVIVRQST
jgi:T-complex protein 1 subunit theta